MVALLWYRPRTKEQIAATVFCGTGTDVNWVIVREGSDLTLVDAGWRGDAARLEASIREIGGRPEDVRAILLTHAHADHIGGVPAFRRRFGTPLLMHERELANARGEVRETGRPTDVLARAWRPRVLTWGLRMIRAGALHHETVTDGVAFAARAPGIVAMSGGAPGTGAVGDSGLSGGASDAGALDLPDAGALDLPGGPVAIPCPGHTSGHCAYLFPSAGVVATGDALVTGHALFRAPGPQVLRAPFSLTDAGALRALDAFDGVEAGMSSRATGRPGAAAWGLRSRTRGKSGGRRRGRGPMAR